MSLSLRPQRILLKINTFNEKMLSTLEHHKIKKITKMEAKKVKTERIEKIKNIRSDYLKYEIGHQLIINHNSESFTFQFPCR